jgi:serine/threonine protein kinase
MADDLEDTVYRDFINYVHKNLWVSSPEYAGWLQKRSSNWLLSSSFFGSRAWAAKWVSLHGSELVYMDKEPLLYNTTVKSALDENSSTKDDHLNVRRAQINGSTIFSADEENHECGFVVQFQIDNMPNWHFRASSHEEKTNWLVKLSQVQAIVCWLEEYERVKILGVGGQGIVYELMHKVTSLRCALKEIEIKSDRQMANAVGEAQFLKTIVEKVSHPNIMQIQKVFQVGSKFYLVFPLCTGGELYDALVKRGHFTEFDAARIMQELIGGLHTLHEHDILHLDIKPENILFETTDFYSKIKLTDFGLSKLFSEVAKDSKGKRCVFADPANKDKTYDEIVEDMFHGFMNSGDFDTQHIRGTYGYMSPELILCGTYSKSLDVFAAGVVLYILLCGYPPFYSKSNRQTFIRTIRGMYRLEGADWDHISLEAKDLVQRMLEKDPRKRITTAEILQHPWITSVNVKLDEVVTDFGAISSLAELAEESNKVATKSSQPMSTQEVPPPPSMVPTLNELPLSQQTVPPTVVSNVSTAVKLPSIRNLSINSMPPINSNLRQLSMQMRRNSLRTSISNLANHVAVLHTNKIAATVTKIMSIAAEGNTAYHSRLAAIYLKSFLPNDYLHSTHNLPVQQNTGLASGTQQESPTTSGRLHSENSDKSVDVDANTFSPEQLFVLVGNETKAALGRAILSTFGSNRRLSLEQFLKVRRYFGYQPLQCNSDITSSVASPSKGSAMTGGSSAKESGTSSILGDANNFVNLGDLLMVRMVDRDGDGYITVEDILTLQILLMQKHDQFLQAVFRIYAEAVWYPGKHLNMLHAMQQITTSNNEGSIPFYSDDKFNVIEPPRFITAKHVAAIFEKFGYSPENGTKVFDILCNALQKLKHVPQNLEEENAEEPVHIPTTIAEDEETGDELDGEELEKSILKQQNGVQLHGASSFHSSKADNSGKDGDSFIDRLRKRSEAFSKLRQQALQLAAPQGNSMRMDVNDFIRVARIDDVLVQVVFRHTHETIYSLIKYCERKAQLELMAARQCGIANPTIDLESIFLDQLRKFPDTYRPQPLPSINT